MKLLVDFKNCPFRKPTELELRGKTGVHLCCRGPLEGHTCKNPFKETYLCSWMCEKLREIGFDAVLEGKGLR